MNINLHALRMHVGETHNYVYYPGPFKQNLYRTSLRAENFKIKERQRKNQGKDSDSQCSDLFKELDCPSSINFWWFLETPTLLISNCNSKHFDCNIKDRQRKNQDS